MKKFIVFYLSVFLFFSCKKESIPFDGFEEDKAYYPVQTGKYITYAYDSLIFDDNGSSKYEFSGYLKEEVGELLEEGNDFKRFKLIKYWKKNEAGPWILTDIESITLTENSIIKTEENLPFIKLVFPNQEGTKWDGNSMFDSSIEVTVYGEPLQPYEFWEYEVSQKDSPLSLNQLNFDNTLEVIQVDDRSSSFELRYSKEVFAKDIGLIKKEIKIYDTQNPRPGEPWENYAQKGYSLVQEIIDHN